MEYDVNAIKASIFDQKAHYELGDHHIDSLLKPEGLSSVILNNEMSYQEEIQDNSSLFNFNSYCNEIESLHDNEASNILSNGHIKTSQEDDYLLRVESKRAGFASKYLFNKATNIQEEVEEDESYENEDSYCSADYSNSSLTDGFCSNISVASPESSVEPIMATPMRKV